MDSLDKKMILSGINEIDNKSLSGFVINEEISLSEMLVAGLNSVKLNSLELNILLDLINSGKISLADLESAGLTKSKVNEIKLLETKLKASVDSVKRKQQLLNDIENGNVDAQTIKNHLLDDELTENDLLKISGFNSELINKLRNYKKRLTPFNTWKDLPPLQEDCTDIYFFGTPGSGKSCILASIFHYANKYGLMFNSGDNLTGVKYRDQLIDEIHHGVLPASTSEQDGVNYIPIEFGEPDNLKKKHPLNFIEMSGELFKKAYDSGIDNENINAKDYLSNDNRKLVFFVLDYHQHVHSENVNDGAPSQSSLMNKIIGDLAKFNILDKTDGISIIISKADLFPTHYERNQYALDFVKKNYLAFVNMCKEYKNKYGLKLFVIPYSIGDVKFQNLLVSRNEDDTKSLIEERILSDSFSKSSGGFLNMFR